MRAATRQAAGRETGGPPPGEIRALTGLRALAATWVVVLHFSNNPGSTWAPVLEPVRPLIMSGWLGVDLFFVLSGFVLTHTYLTKIGPRAGVRSAAAFYWNRLSRVWPTWIVVVVAFTAWLTLKHLTVGGLHVHEADQPHVDVVHLLAQVFMVQQWAQPMVSGSTFPGPGWSLSAEWLAYVVFPVLVLGLYRLRRLPVAVLGAGAVLALLPFAWIAATDATHEYAWAWLLRIAGAFVAGSLTALCVRRVQPTERVRRGASIVAAVALVWIGVVVWWSAARWGDYAGVAVLAFPVLVGALAFADRGPARLLSTPWMVTGGRISFALYLVHLFVFEVWWTAMDVVPHLQPDSTLASLGAPLVLVAPFPLAWATWRYVEEPARLYMRRYAPRTGPSRAARPAVHERAENAGGRAPDLTMPLQRVPVSDAAQPTLVSG
ncbi:acyltransferase [Geodermatophilus aquaeductus]|uniref:Peptidoglycan/LPS O-acetylase OafA/YrhL, contains acyltransferase and SGNH-hydrolase domains n=1 Tax=Geodermatophilus aquaeductus TaxID=1564161 RepID=A0A521ADC9_9ACTN|nr:acyltransferase [Geodermatophilus aquaeductus]SMO32781.1 Peptidoglycan/LPS O-acetylase OafA/YrhL, contains acyltransferase and SGNH-hydrolase domains [Geodermatophilus aquaeductus]